MHAYETNLTKGARTGARLAFAAFCACAALVPLGVSAKPLVPLAKSAAKVLKPIAAPVSKGAVDLGQGMIEQVQQDLATLKSSVVDIAEKFEELDRMMREKQPMMDALAPVMEGVEGALDFVQDMHADYQRFEPRAEAFRHDLQGFFSDVLGLAGDFPGFDGGGDAIDRLQDALGLIGRLPTQFLFLLDTAVGAQLTKLQKAVEDVYLYASMLPPLPSAMEVGAAVSDPATYAPQLCTLVTDRYVPLAVVMLQNTLNYISFALKSVAGLLPKDLVLEGTVGAGGGITLSAHPAGIPFHVVGTVIIDGINLSISSKMTLAKAFKDAGWCE